MAWPKGQSIFSDRDDIIIIIIIIIVVVVVVVVVVVIYIVERYLSERERNTKNRSQFGL